MSFFESTVDDKLGLWAATPLSGAVSFGISDAAAQPAGDIYRTNLPADVNAAHAVFDASESALINVKAAMDTVPGNLDDLVQRTRQKRQASSSGVSFQAEFFEQESGLEGELLGLVEEADRNVMQDLSFGIGSLPSLAMEIARTEFNKLITQVDRDVMHFAWVETNISKLLVAHTTVGWSGNMQTALSADVSADQTQLHERTLTIATLTRNLRLRLFMTVAGGAVKMAGLMAAPGGVILALPAVYQYVTKIVSQVKELQSIQSS